MAFVDNYATLGLGYESSFGKTGFGFFEVRENYGLVRTSSDPQSPPSWYKIEIKSSQDDILCRDTEAQKSLSRFLERLSLKSLKVFSSYGDVARKQTQPAPTKRRDDGSGT